MLTPFFTDRPVRDFASATSADPERYAAFFRGMLSRGIYPPPSQFEAWFLSMAHTRRDVDKTIRAAKEAQPSWANATPVRRGDLLRDITVELDSRKKEIVALVAAGHRSRTRSTAQRAKARRPQSGGGRW